jgi:serine/threonine protein phosphatase PrpC
MLIAATDDHAAQRLVEAALAREAGDNVTAVVLDVLECEDGAPNNQG